MHTIHIAITHPINPSPNTHHPLTIPEIWAGLVLKCHKPQLFVASMSDCEVLSEDAHGLKRIVTFKDGQGPPAGRATEDITYYAPLKAEFHMPATGTKIANIVSQGPRYAEDGSDLYLTFTFEWPFPDLVEESAEAVERERALREMGDQTVGHTIAVLREMVGRGEL